MTTAARSGSPTLLLIPTAVEERELEDQGGFEPGLAIRMVCGFGPIAAAARAAQVLANLHPARVLLVGIAGTFDPDRLPVGAAEVFDAVAIDGIGAGEGEGALGPAQLGFPQWPGGSGTRAARIDERIALAHPRAQPITLSGARAQPITLARSRALGARGSARSSDASEPALLLSACCASGSRERAAERRRRFPEALAEDMEGFGVALACALAEVPLVVIRGISNQAGDRDPARWHIPSALAAARELALAVLREP